MVKAKMGALALTVLMGLGIAGNMNVFSGTDAQNVSAANSVKQKTVVSTTNDSGGVMSYKDKESGKIFVSEDNGVTWVPEEDYNNSHPAINYEWWTYDEYKEWLEQEKKTLQEMADEHTMVETSEGSFEWTQEMTDQCIAEYEQTLKEIKNGLHVSKSVDGDEECMTTFNPNWVGSTEADYEKNNEAPDVQWWTADEYEAWMNEQKKEMESLIGTGDGWYDGQGVFHEFTQESVDAMIASYKETLESIKSGVLYSKDNGDGDTYSMIPPTEDVVSSYSVDVTKDNGKTVHIGNYATVEELDKAISDAAKNGQLTQEEADAVRQ